MAVVRTCNICNTETEDLVKDRTCAGGYRPRCKSCHSWERKKLRLGLMQPLRRPPTGKRAEIMKFWADRREIENKSLITVSIEGEQ